MTYPLVPLAYISEQQNAFSWYLLSKIFVNSQVLKSKSSVLNDKLLITMPPGVKF